MVDVGSFRNAMAMLGGAVSVITTDGVAGRFGFTASAVCSVTDSPPTLLVCMNRSSHSNEHFKHNGTVCEHPVRRSSATVRRFRQPCIEHG